MVQNFDPTNPTDGSIVSQFPANERASRLAIETAYDFGHDRAATGLAASHLEGSARILVDVAASIPAGGLTEGYASFATDDRGLKVDDGTNLLDLRPIYRGTDAGKSSITPDVDAYYYATDTEKLYYYDFGGSTWTEAILGKNGVIATDSDFDSTANKTFHTGSSGWEVIVFSGSNPTVTVPATGNYAICVQLRMNNAAISPFNRWGAFFALQEDIDAGGYSDVDFWRHGSHVDNPSSFNQIYWDFTPTANSVYTFRAQCWSSTTMKYNQPFTVGPAGGPADPALGPDGATSFAVNNGLYVTLYSKV